MNDLLCVGGPLHGERKPRSHTYVVPTLRRNGELQRHVYRARRLTDGRIYLAWSIVPYWNLPGFRKPGGPPVE